MSQNYLKIAREFINAARETSTTNGAVIQSTTTEASASATTTGAITARVVNTAAENSLARERSEKSERSSMKTPASTFSLSQLPSHPLFAGLDDRGEDPELLAQTSRVDPTEYDQFVQAKDCTTSSRVMRDELEQLQAWLVTVDWRMGLRCGMSGQQCRICRGIPCLGSTEWTAG